MKSLLRLGPFLRPYKLKILLTLLMLLVMTAIDMAFPALIRQVIDVGLNAGQIRFLVLATIVILSLALLKSVITIIERYQTELISNRIAYDLRNQLYDHIQHLTFTYFDHVQSGQLISRCIEDVRSIQGFTGQGVPRAHPGRAAHRRYFGGPFQQQYPPGSHFAPAADSYGLPGGLFRPAPRPFLPGSR